MCMNKEEENFKGKRFADILFYKIARIVIEKFLFIIDSTKFPNQSIAD